MLHCVFGLVGCQKFNVAESAAVLGMETIGGEFDELDFSVAAEDLDDVFLGDIACETADVDAGRTRRR